MRAHSRGTAPSNSKRAPAWTGPSTRGSSEFPVVGAMLARPGEAPLSIALGEGLGCQRTSYKWGAVPLLLLNDLVSPKLLGHCVCVLGEWGGVSCLPWGVLLNLATAFQRCHGEHLASRRGRLSVLRVCLLRSTVFIWVRSTQRRGREAEGYVHGGRSADLPFFLLPQVPPRQGLIWCTRCQDQVSTASAVPRISPLPFVRTLRGTQASHRMQINRGSHFTPRCGAGPRTC